MEAVEIPIPGTDYVDCNEDIMQTTGRLVAETLARLRAAGGRLQLELYLHLRPVRQHLDLRKAPNTRP